MDIIEKVEHKGKEYIIADDIDFIKDGNFQYLCTRIRIKVKHTILRFAYYCVLKSYKYDNTNTRNIQIHNARKWIKNNILNK